MKKYIFIAIVVSFLGVFSYKVLIKNTDLTINGSILNSDGIGRQTIDLIKMLSELNLDINFIGKVISKKDIGSQVESVLNNKNYKIGKIFINEENLDLKPFYKKSFYKFLSKINGLDRNQQIWYAYTMFESDEIKSTWVNEINKNYDAAIVPDENLIPIYKKSGVTSPIFTIPLGVDLDLALAAPIKTKAHKVFTFANFSAIENRKNTLKLVKAFHLAFGNNNNVKLMINSRRVNKVYASKIIDYMHENHITNIDYIIGDKSKADYNNLFDQIDCYVSLSKGEGFSVQPREAMARGIPVIVSDALAQKTIADSKLVRAVNANITQLASYDHYIIGKNYDVELNDAVEAMQDVYNNYPHYLSLAPEAREWAKQYSHGSSKDLFISLVRPKKVILGSRNQITKDYIETTSQALYDKYLKNNISDN